ncbi:ThuA-like domain-containing protein [Fusarium redolens]|jgi:type 1 glutamine amidotransferase|uniref:ThuA-like domain-containing protein n=1 Tax=Fusarium redolens TaxID=48865 RepID=A0A9P9FYY1_FUSRE|nr:ThuA-like domain-containing protein [Fusarium redolens]KAH7222581.1 ThuA-like domain-containing protein [Fusarium redolens]
MASTAFNSIKVLLVTKTCGYRHDCIPALISAFNSLLFDVKATEDSSHLLSLSDFDVVALGHNTGDYLTEEEVSSLLNFVENGGGVVGIHAATSGLKTNARYTKILGEVFNGHPPPEWMTLAVENPDHYINGYDSLPGPDSAPESAPACPVKTESLPAKHFPWFDEVYTFKSHPRIEGRTVLLSVQGDNEESAETSGFPLSWTHTVGKGRVYYTALGHFDEAYKDTWFMGSLRRAVIWAAKKE